MVIWGNFGDCDCDWRSRGFDWQIGTNRRGNRRRELVEPIKQGMIVFFALLGGMESNDQGKRTPESMFLLYGHRSFYLKVTDVLLSGGGGGGKEVDRTLGLQHSGAEGLTRTKLGWDWRAWKLKSPLLDHREGGERGGLVNT
ncbi:hypothetical protein EV2_014683 [Malus domestica]